MVTFGGKGKISQATVYGRGRSTSTSTSKTYTDPAAIKQMRSLFAQAKAIYAPEGKYMTGIEAGIKRGEKKAVAGGMQGLAAAGLAGTSMAGGLSKKYQEEVAQPALASATTARLSALSGILSQEAGAEGSMAARYSTSTTPLARSYGGGGGGSATPGFGTGRAAGYKPPAAPSRTTTAKAPTKTEPLSLSIQPYSPTKKTGQVYFGKAYYDTPARVSTDSGPVKTTAYGMELGMPNYAGSGLGR